MLRLKMCSLERNEVEILEEALTRVLLHSSSHLRDSAASMRVE